MNGQGIFTIGEISPPESVGETNMAALPEDPLEWLVSNPVGRSLLQALGDGKDHVPLELRKALHAHPEAFRRSVHALDLYDLLSVHARRGARVEGTPRGFGIEVALTITPKGGRVLGILQEFTAVLKGHAHDLPRATKERWLAA